MIRVEKVILFDLPCVEIYGSDGQLVLSTSDMDQAVMRLATMGVDKPEEIVRAALHWGAVDIYEREDGGQLPLLWARVLAQVNAKCAAGPLSMPDAALLF